MGESSQSTTALLTEHLQYTPLSLIDDIINSVNGYVIQGITSLENGFSEASLQSLGFKPIRPSGETRDQEADGEFGEAKQEIEEGLHQLETLLNSAVDRNFDKFEIYVLRNILSVPEELTAWIQLKHYEDLPHPQLQNPPTPDSVHLLRRQVAESQRLGSHLKAEASRNDAVISQLKGLLASGNAAQDPSMESSQSDFSFLSSAPSAAAMNISTIDPSKNPLTTNTNFALSQLPALQSLLADLRLKVAGLQDQNGTSKSARAERGDERREYVELRAEMHMQRNAGRASGDHGAVSGKRVEPEEVEALEQIAEIFDKG